MASLRNIMNVDDDHVDSHSLKKSKESAPRSHHHPTSSASASSYANPADLSVANSSSSSGIAARGHSSNPPAHGLSSLDVDTASSSSFGLSHTTANYSQDRRQSNTSTDSMDSPYGQGHGHGHPGGSYSGTPMRPFVPGAEAPVKLTPITGRVSRAKKGLAVHTCETCRPPKTFTRAEHLRRHQLSHQPPELSCQVPGCDKVFHRKDLLDRHLQKHDQDNRTAKSTPRQSSTARSFGSRSPRHGSYGPSPPGSMLSMGHPFSSPPPGATSAANTSSQGVHMMPGHWASTGGSTAHIRSASDNFSLMDSVPGLQSASSKASGFSQARPPTGLGVMDVPELNLQDVGSANVPWQDSSGVVTSSSGSSYSTPPSEVSRAPATVRAPSAEWTAPLGPPVASRTLQSPIAVSGAYPAPFGYDSSPPAVYPSVYGDGAGVLLPGYDESLYNPQIPSNTVRNSLSPQLAVGPSSETLVTAPAALAPDRVISPMLCGRQPDTAFGFLMAGDLIHVPLSREARNEIPVYIDKYWEKVHPLYPIIHRPSFEDASGVDSQHHDILRCAMAAVATQFLEHKEHRINGSQLHAHALHECKRIPQSNWSLSIMQALLLCEHYAQFRGRSKEAYLPSAQFNALCQMVANSQFALDSVTLGCDNFQRWRSWTHLESCRRILSACFLLSVHGIWYYEQPVTSFLGLDNFSPMMLSIPLSAGTKKAWEAETADSWASIDFSTVKSRTVGDAMQEQLSPAMIESMPRFDSSLLLAAHALQLPRRRNPTEVDIFQDASCIKPHDMVIPTLFQHSPGGYTYLALHYTPLQCLLSVSGDSWILNNKVSHPSIFIDHKMKLQKWRRSGNAAAATVFAAKALRIFLNLGPNAFGHNDVLLAGQKRSLPSWTDISDFWGVYVCALICWAFGYEGKRNPSKSSRGAAVGWLLTVSELEPGDLQNLTGREESQGVVGLIHDVLGRDCLGGRNILYADAVRVLRKLEEVDNWAWI